MMKHIAGHTLAIILLTVALSTGCAHTGRATENDASEEQVRVGYGTQEKDEVTSSVSSVNTEGISETTYTRLEDMLEGRVAGVQIIRRGDAISVRIRGTSTIPGADEPLYVVDGVPMEPIPGHGIQVAPHEIARIEVLKDAGATSIYGWRGANGVILITTKRGRD